MARYLLCARVAALFVCGACSSAPEAETCVERSQWIYLVSADDTLIRFRPDAVRERERFERVGKIECDARLADGSLSHPFSMSVDREATAWVLHDNGEVYRVSTSDAECDTRSPLTASLAGIPLAGIPQAQPLLFGMGFVGAGFAGSDTQETLFVSGLSPTFGGETGSARLGTLNTETGSVTELGVVDGWPELTGTAERRLWGFFLETFSVDEAAERVDTGASVQELDLATGATLQRFDLPLLNAIPESYQLATFSYAFAHWGGRYYVFLARTFQDTSTEPARFIAWDASTEVWELDPATGRETRILDETGFQIVGAGVSTCAPTTRLE